VILNNFGDEAHQKLATITFQNMFPPINVRKVKLSTCQRAVLVDYDAKTKRFQFRHYSINAAPVGANKKLKKLLQSRNAPDLGDTQDVSEFFDKRVGDASDSEGSDDESRRVHLTQDFNRVAHADSTSKIILNEIGPRMELELVKVEEGMCDGRVLYHAYVKKTAEEVKTLEQKKVEREKLRKRRRVEQEANVKRKAREKEIKADAERARQGKSKKKSSAVDEFGNVRDVEGEAEDDAKWAAAFEREEKEWQEGDVYDERSGKTKRKRHGD
jgi:ribosome biogenesis protein SSF1/2